MGGVEALLHGHGRIGKKGIWRFHKYYPPSLVNCRVIQVYAQWKMEIASSNQWEILFHGLCPFWLVSGMKSTNIGQISSI